MTIPESIISIKDRVFKGCSSLEDISLPDGLVWIGEEAFYGCSSLKEIKIPDSSTICARAFLGCRNLTTVNIPESANIINEGVFSGCTSLREIKIPDSVVSIYNNAFLGCTSLTSIDLPENLEFISARTFYGCIALESISVPDKVTLICENAFEGCISLKSIVINENLKEIREEAFLNCDKLKEITIPQSVAFIGEAALNGCPITVIHGYSGSAAQEYADAAGIKFDSLGQAAVKADQNIGKGGISVENLPDKLVYDIGEDLDLTGGIIRGAGNISNHNHVVLYWNIFGDKMDTFDVDSSEFNNQVPGTYSIYIHSTIQSFVYTTSFEVTVTDKSASSGTESDVKDNPDLGKVKGTDACTILYGDIDGNYTIDVSDLTQLSLAILGDVTLSDSQNKCADVCLDGDINLADLALLKQYIMKDHVKLGVSNQNG